MAIVALLMILLLIFDDIEYQQKLKEDEKMRCSDVELILGMALVVMLAQKTNSMAIAVVAVVLVVLIATHQMVRFERELQKSAKK